VHVSHFAFISITFSLFYHYSPIITHFYTSLSVICLIFCLILHIFRMLIMFNVAVILVVGPIFTLFLFHHFLNIYTLSYNNLSISYPSSVWSIFCFWLSAFLLSLQYFLIYLISFLLKIYPYFESNILYLPGNLNLIIITVSYLYILYFIHSMYYLSFSSAFLLQYSLHNLSVLHTLLLFFPKHICFHRYLIFPVVSHLILFHPIS